MLLLAFEVSSTIVWHVYQSRRQQCVSTAGLSSQSGQLRTAEKRQIFIQGAAVPCMGAWVHGCRGAWVHGCRGAQHSLCSTVSKDSMRDLTVAAGSGSASPLASLGEAGIMQHWSDAGPSSPWDLTDTVNKVVVYARNSQLPPHVGIWFCRLPERMKHC